QKALLFEDPEALSLYLCRQLLGSGLVEVERKEEMRRHENEIRSMSRHEREAKGRALVGMSGRDEGEGIGGYEVKFVKERGDRLPDTEIGVGDLVMVSKNDPLRDDNPTGTVTQVTNHSVTASFDSKPPGFVFGDGLRVDLYVNDVTYQRMLDALDGLLEVESESESKSKSKSESPGMDFSQLRDVIVGTENPSESKAEKADFDIGSPDSDSGSNWHNDSLNESQMSAVRQSLNGEGFHLIHGPPGTGKTTTVVEVIHQCVDRGESVLATAASNTAVDSIVESLVGSGESLEVVRLGHPARVTPELRQHSLDRLLEKNEKYQRSRSLREEAFDLLERQDDLTPPSGRWRRGLSDERIKELAEEGRGSRGVPPEKIEEMAEWLEIREEADDLFERSDELEDEAVSEVIGSADVVCTTNSTSGSDLLDGFKSKFDTLVIDEATQATEPSCLIPIVSARPRRVVMAGDHRQLPPTVQSEDAARANPSLRETLFERLAEHDSIRSLLRTQYRMNTDIMEFPSHEFYDDALEADSSVAEHTLDGLGVSVKPFSSGLQRMLNPENPLVFVNTAGVEASERQPEGSTSRENPREADFVSEIVDSYLNAGLDASDIAVISPYDDQVDAIEDRMRGTEALEVDTVDGFQGREKEVVVISLVRSNEENEVGFLDNPRRFNVALTRARRKVLVIGDAETVGSADVYREFHRYVRESENALEIEL
ncbi:MAG: IGHMBP2 family helicase, partial [Halobacteria archaeon]|nr:IGHMBP2 family helicase [Halobacteria archaeon]